MCFCNTNRHHRRVIHCNVYIRVWMCILCVLFYLNKQDKNRKNKKINNVNILPQEMELKQKRMHLKIKLFE